jgi:phenylacetic acid degradation operon negative regulatory protein
VAARDLAVTLLGTYVREGPPEVWAGGMIRLLEDLGVAAPAGRVALSRLAARGLVSRTKRGRLAWYGLTPAGQRLLEEGTQRIFTFGLDAAGQQIWTVLAYSIPDARRRLRTELRKRLQFLGFASQQDGVWIAPRDHEAEVGELLEELELRGDALLLVGRLGGGMEAELIQRAWDLEPVRAAYANFLDTYGEYRDAGRRRRMSPLEAFVVRTRIVHDFRGFPRIDPELPEASVATPLRRPEAVALFHLVYDALEARAQAHVDARLALAEGAK